MTDAFTLHDVTGAMGEALRRRPPEWHVAHEREIRLFVDDTIAILRASAAHASREYEASSASLTEDPLEHTLIQGMIDKHGRG